MALLAAARGALAGAAAWDGALVVADAGAARALASLGGAGWLLDDLGAATVAALEAGAEAAEALAGWRRARAGAAAARPGDPARLVFVVTGPLAGLEAALTAFLRAEYGAPEVEARILSGLSARAQARGGQHHRAREELDFDDLAGRLRQASGRLDAVRVDIVHAPWAVDLLVDTAPDEPGAAPWAAFALASDAAQTVFPATLSRHGLSGKRASLDEVDGNADLSEDFKAALRMTARELLDTLVTTLHLDFSHNCWAAGFTSRVLGNAMLGYLKEDARAITSPLARGAGSRAKPAKLILIDRTLDLAGATAHNLSPLVGDFPEGGDDHRVKAETAMGPLSTRQAWDADANRVLRSLTASDADRAGRALTSYVSRVAPPSPGASSLVLAMRGVDPARLASDHVLVSASLALENRLQPERRGLLATERILLETATDATHKLLPLVDLCTRQSYPREELQRLALLAHALLSRVEPSEGDADAEAVFADAVEASGVSKHVVKALREARHDARCRDVAPSEPLAVAILGRALSKARTPACLTRLGESALEKTAKEIENHARKWIKQGFSAFGFGSHAKSDGGGQSGDAHSQEQHQREQRREQERQQLEIHPGETCVLFFVGGVCRSDMRAVAEFLERHGSAKPALVLLGGTSLTSAERVVKESFRVVQVPAFLG